MDNTSSTPTTKDSEQELTVLPQSAPAQQAHEDIISVAETAVEQIEAAGGTVIKSQERYERGLAAKAKRALEEAYVDQQTEQARHQQQRVMLLAECIRFKSMDLCGELLYERSRNPKPCARPSVRCDPRGYCQYHRNRYGYNKGEHSARAQQRKAKESKLAAIRSRRAQRHRPLPECNRLTLTKFLGKSLALPAPSRPKVELLEPCKTGRATRATKKKQLSSRRGRRKLKLLKDSTPKDDFRLLASATHDGKTAVRLSSPLQQDDESLAAPTSKLAITSSFPPGDGVLAAPVSKLAIASSSSPEREDGALAAAFSKLTIAPTPFYALAKKDKDGDTVMIDD